MPQLHRTCVSCGNDISHRGSNARKCEACIQLARAARKPVRAIDPHKIRTDQLGCSGGGWEHDTLTREQLLAARGMLSPAGVGGGLSL